MTVAQPSSIKPTIDLDAAGKHQGFLKLPHSVTRSAYGWIPIPIVSVKNGEGPCVLLVGGNHGDEYEGQIALMSLVRTVQPSDIQGQLIILSAANFPAVMAASRISPIDEGNLNREFPGKADGTPTQMIAHYITTELAPRCDYSFDIHSGGASLDYIPTVLTVRPPDEAGRARVKALVEALALPFTSVFKGGGVSGGRTLASCVKMHGGTPLAAELGGRAGVTPQSMAVVRGALRRYLAATGVWVGSKAPPAAVQTQLVAVSPDDYLYAEEAGIFEPACVLGDTVTAGQCAGEIHFPDTPWKPAHRVHFARDGVIVCARPVAHCARGDCLFQTAQAWSDALD